MRGCWELGEGRAAGSVGRVSVLDGGSRAWGGIKCVLGLLVVPGAGLEWGMGLQGGGVAWDV